MRFHGRYAAAAVLLLLISSVPARAAWILNGVGVCTSLAFRQAPTITSDGAGGAIIAWFDYRNGSADIYVQRVNRLGVSLWTADGVALCTAANDQTYPTIAGDGAGGAIVTWSDYRGGPGDIYARRVNAAGVPQWTANGVALCAATNDQSKPMIVSDGAGGAIVTWQDLRSGVSDIYAQRVNAAGAPQWTANGVALCSATNDQQDPVVVSDGATGAIVTWQDLRGGTLDIYAQRVNAAGATQWTANGVVISATTGDQFRPRIISDGAGGAVITWIDVRSGDHDVYATRVNAAGSPQWTSNGVPLCTIAGVQAFLAIASDDTGGAIVTWYDYRSGAPGVYARRVTAAGTPLWTAHGVALCTVSNGQAEPQIVADGVGGAIVTWSDRRAGPTYDIYTQRINANGAIQWTTDGVALSTATGSQIVWQMCSDGAGGEIVSWTDDRNNSTPDIYAQRVEPDFGAWGRPEPFVTSVSDVPSDQGGKVAVNWTRSGRDLIPFQEISHYSVWRAVDEVALSSYIGASRDDDAWVDPASIGPEFDGSAITRERIHNVDYYWEWVANQNAAHDAGYSYAATTREDSVGGDAAVHYFRVIAHTANPYVLYKSNAVSGYSVDNLAPAAPLQLVAQRVGADVQLKWNRVRVPDLRDYSVYRGTSSGVTPIPMNFLASDDDTVLVDTSAPVTVLYYIVTAYDIHANQSAPSNEAIVQALTGIGNTPPITALTVLQNHPNPFAATTTLQIGLPAASNVEINLYDVAGRSVRGITLEGVAAGWRSIPFDGRDDRGRTLASGVYFYRVSANGTTVSRKMIIAR